MAEFNFRYTGHARKARRFLVESGLVREETLLYMTDWEVARKINNNFLCLEDGEDWVLIPKELEDKLIRICR